MRVLDYNEIRLIRYTKLIDKAIVAKRYGLATQLAYRCVYEYHRLFMRFLVPQKKLLRKNAFQMTVDVVGYFRAKPGWFTFKRSRWLFSMLKTSYYLTRLSKRRFADRDLHVDMATAVFARDQALAISKFLFGSLKDSYKSGELQAAPVKD
ncbi:MAG: hypothetical protein R3301_15370 [Saprospiraceae bacterium]|nr:hypothetical protein [Saprospiraceae bacterium]